VELAPPYDSSEITSQLAARLITDVLAARFPSR
jgi:arginase family enzyme